MSRALALRPSNTSVDPSPLVSTSAASVPLSSVSSTAHRRFSDHDVQGSDRQQQAYALVAQQTRGQQCPPGDDRERRR
jgi:hypothetical protein